MTSSKAPARFILGFVCACALYKAIAMFATGFDDDEAYTLVISRTLALSYFDHPPLHQWILHGWVALFGETHGARAPFLAMNIATTGALFGLTRRLFGRDAALWAIFAFNATPYFLVLPDGFITPDAPLLLFLVLAAWGIAEILYRPAGRDWRPWLAAGLAFGAAGLAKYTAILAPIGLFGFFVFSPRHRHWLADPRPYLGAALALLLFSPAVIWNAENHWVSFAFQSSRAATGLDLQGRAWEAIAAGLGAQVALLSPWIGAPMLAGLAGATRTDADGGARLLLWLAAPPLLLFALLPLIGQRAIPHWFNSGWIFAFPLAGAWLAARGEQATRIWSRACAGLAVLTAALYLPAVIVGPARLLAFAPSGARDPTRFSYDWRNLDAAAARDIKASDFVVVDNWRVGGRIGVALGPKIPICAFTSDPRGFAFRCDPSEYLGRDALIVTPADDSAALNRLSAYFESVDPARYIRVGRGDGAERRLSLVRAHVLVRPYPLPYGPAKR
jgi:hypothetical protein